MRWVQKKRSIVQTPMDMGRVHTQEDGPCSQIRKGGQVCQGTGFGRHKGKCVAGQRLACQVQCPMLRTHSCAPCLLLQDPVTFEDKVVCLSFGRSGSP